MQETVPGEPSILLLVRSRPSRLCRVLRCKSRSAEFTRADPLLASRKEASVEPTPGHQSGFQELYWRFAAYPLPGADPLLASLDLQEPPNGHEASRERLSHLILVDQQRDMSAMELR